MKPSVCCIFGAGEYYGDEAVPAGALLIAADGGLRVLEKKGVTPDVIIGDFDSLGYEAQGENIIRLPVIKDDTDTMAAVKYALERGCRCFYLFGCTGGRLSHTLANLQTLTYIAKHAGIGFLFDKEEVAAVTCKGLRFDSSAKGFLSVFAAEGGTQVSESGLKYTLRQQTLAEDFPLGVSNEFVTLPAAVTVHSGAACLIFQKTEMEKLLWE